MPHSLSLIKLNEAEACVTALGLGRGFFRYSKANLRVIYPPLKRATVSWQDFKFAPIRTLIDWLVQLKLHLIWNKFIHSFMQFVARYCELAV